MWKPDYFSYFSCHEPAATAFYTLSLHDALPICWVVRRKAEVVAAVNGGLLTIDEVCERYSLTLEEFASWQRAVDRSGMQGLRDRKSTRLNSSHVESSYAVFCLKKKKTITQSMLI